jgi:ABC-type antimicrobial peptide transport system permease subunit
LDSNNGGVTTLQIPINYMWLKTQDDAASIANVRAALYGGQNQLNSLHDRRAVLDSLQHTFSQQGTIGVIGICAIVPLLLALLGNLVASWLSTRQRLTNLMVLRALGGAPRQVASMLTIEQSIVYITAIGLGLLFGVVIATLVVPALVVTGASSASTDSALLYLQQNVPPVNLVIPLSLVLVLCVLAGFCILVLGVMIYVASRPSISQSLRLNTD